MPVPIASVTLRLDAISPWTALGLFAGIGAFVVLLGIRSMTGLGPVRKWVAIGARLLLLALLILILGDVKLVRRNTDVEVMIVRDISRSTELVSNYPDQNLQASVDKYVLAISDQSHSPSHQTPDKIGQISFNEHAFIDAIPEEHLHLDARAVRGPGTGTDASGAIQLALASMDSQSLHRLLLIWDGNATTGDLNDALATAVSQHVPIDVMPLQYNVRHEVMMDKFIAPTRRQEGQPVVLEAYPFSTNAVDVEGSISVTDNGKLIALKDGKTTQQITIHSGRNVVRIEVPPPNVGVHSFHAVLSDVKNVNLEGNDGAAPASQLDNKSADAFTFVQGKGQVLFVDNTDPAHQADYGKYLREAMLRQQINVVSIGPEEFPNDIVSLQGYDAIILANVPRGEGGLSDEQEQMLASYIHNTGGGLVMIGGAQTLGAGGWEGSHLEEELPVTMEVPAQRQIPKGALVLIMDPAEAIDGNGLGEQCAVEAAEALSSQDDIGVLSYAFSGDQSCRWDYPLSPKGSGAKVKEAIKNWQLGDMPNIDIAVNQALDGDSSSPGLIASDARAKHIIVITDDDPLMPQENTILRCIKNNVTISTVTVCPHMPGNVAQNTREAARRTGGKSYGPIESNLAQIPQIFIKEATVVKRSIIQEDSHGIPVTLAPSTCDLVKGLSPGPMPPIYGMDLTGRKDNPLIEVPLTAGTKKDPVLAYWQAGLGRTAVYTGDAFNRWDANWVASDIYDKFWAQVVRGVARSAISSDFETEVTTDGNNGHIVIRATKEGNGFNNFLQFEGAVIGPDMKPHPIRPMQTGPGTYEADFDASAPGSYISYLQYAGEADTHGALVAGTAVNSSPELRDLQSNDTLLQQIADRTGGRYLKPWDTSAADLFARDGLEVTTSPRSIWDMLLPFALALMIIDVAIRRIAWDWQATKRMANAAANAVRQYTTTYRRVESQQTMDNLKRVRGEVADQKFKPAPAPVPHTAVAEAVPNRQAKFEAGEGVAGELSAVVGGATDKPIPSAPKKIEPKGAVGLGDHTNGLFAAKRRAQQKIKQQEEKRE